MNDQPPPEKTTEEKILEAVQSIRNMVQFFLVLTIIVLVLQACSMLY